MTTQPLNSTALSQFLKVAQRASLAAGENSLKYFNQDIEVESKSDATPVTQADREAEEIIRASLEKEFPQHRIIGEEFGENKNDSEFCWWIDPIDGTLQFIRGLPFWGSVLGLEYQGQMVAGVLHFPAIQLTVWASKAGGCYANGKPARVSAHRDMSKALLLHSGLRLIEDDERQRLSQAAKLCRDDRGIGDAFGHSLVIRGIADALVDFRVNPHDVSAVKICVEEAGGRFSSLSGEDSIHSLSIISSNGHLHEAFCSHLNRGNTDRRP